MANLIEFAQEKKVKKINETDEKKSKGKTAIGKTIEVISVDPWAPIGATDIGKQSKEEVEKKSLGCNSCHQGVEKMHVDENQPGENRNKSQLRLGRISGHDTHARYNRSLRRWRYARRSA